MGFADLHIHSLHSDGTATLEAILYHAAARTTLDVIAITDHDQLDPALRARDLAASYGIEVAPGMEISTREGHLLALWLERPAPAGLSFVETAERVRALGGLPFAAHPTAAWARSVGAARLRQIVADHPGLLAGIEVENGSLPDPRQNQAAQRLRWELGLAAIANSDAHTLADIGCARTAFAGHSATQLRAALEAGQITPLPLRRRRHFVRHMALRLALRFGAGVVDALETAPGHEAQVVWRRK